MANEPRTVSIVERKPGRWWPSIRSVTVPWVCCTCGGPRGEPFGHNFHEDGEWFHCDRWENPCGHVDKYVDVARQAAMQMATAP